MVRQIERRLRGQNAASLQISRLRLAGLARQMEHRRQPDGLPVRPQLLRRRPVCPDHVPLAAPHARAGAGRHVAGRAWHRLSRFGAPIARREAALNGLQMRNFGLYRETETFGSSRRNARSCRLMRHRRRSSPSLPFVLSVIAGSDRRYRCSRPRRAVHGAYHRQSGAAGSPHRRWPSSDGSYILSVPVFMLVLGSDPVDWRAIERSGWIPPAASAAVCNCWRSSAFLCRASRRVPGRSGRRARRSSPACAALRRWRCRTRSRRSL